MKNVIESLFYPKKKSDFLKCYEANLPFVNHGLDETISELTGLSLLYSLDHLLQCWPKKVEVHLPGISDEANAVEVNPSDAKKMFETGMGLLFKNANEVSPQLSQWLDKFRVELGLSAMTNSRNLIYATKSGHGTAPHFDQNINFVIQIYGAKKWLLAPNLNVDSPMTRHTMGLPMDSELSGYAKSPMPTQMPDDATEIILKAGSVLFVPRGTWHSTHAMTDALSLNFTFSAPTWIDIFTSGLRSRLSHLPEWRQTANFISNPERCLEAQETFNMLLTEISFEAPDWKADDFLNLTESKLK